MRRPTLHKIYFVIAFIIIVTCLLFLRRETSNNDNVHPDNIQSVKLRSAAEKKLSESEKSEKEFSVPLLKNAVKINSKCSAHTELNQVDFFHDELRSRLCTETPAFTLVNGQFPPCKIPWNLPLTHLISPVSLTLPKLFTDLQLTVYVHDGELLTNYLKGGKWENELVQLVIALIKEIGMETATFLDIGCNIGLYALHARSFGIKTVCVDANIRNLVRVLMSAKRLKFEDDKKFQMYWAFFDSKVGIQHFRYVTKECHIGAATPFLPKSVSFEDPVPVASSRGDGLIGRMPSDILVIKIDIESYEPVFFDTARGFFDAYRVAAVQMEIYRNSFHQKLEISFLEDFFFTRRFKLFTTDLKEGSLRNWKGGNECLWVHENFVPLLENIRKKLDLKS